MQVAAAARAGKTATRAARNAMTGKSSLDEGGNVVWGPAFSGRVTQEMTRTSTAASGFDMKPNTKATQGQVRRSAMGKCLVI